MRAVEKSFKIRRMQHRTSKGGPGPAVSLARQHGAPGLASAPLDLVRHSLWCATRFSAPLAFVRHSLLPVARWLPRGYSVADVDRDGRRFEPW
jgi:hypothetical protein